MRNISAPFQGSQEGSVSNDPKVGRLREQPTGDYLDYTNSTFQPLEPIPQLTLDKYCGPTPESNWVIPGRLLVGAYPASQSDVETFELLISILKLNITTFVCLQQEYRTHGITEAMWRSGHALRPYFEDVKLIIKNKSMFKSLSEHPGIVDSDKLDFVHFPIKDCSISDDAAVLKLSQSLVTRINNGEKLYLHCWGGHGRTGTVVCIMLHLMYGLSARESMAYCQRAHDLRQCPVNVGSPQTESQRDQVTRVVSALLQHRQAQRIAALGPPPTTSAPITSESMPPIQGAAQSHYNGQMQPQKVPSVKDMTRITQGTEQLTINPNVAIALHSRNNIAARSSEGDSPSAMAASNGGVPMILASPPSTPPASSSGKRGGRTINYTVSGAAPMKLSSPEQAAAVQQDQQQSEAPSSVLNRNSDTNTPTMEISEMEPIVMESSSVLVAVALSSSRPVSPSPLTHNRSLSSSRVELHPHIVTLGTEELREATHPGALSGSGSHASAESSPINEELLLKTIPPDLVEGKTVKPHVGLYPMVRMPTERMKTDLDMSLSPPGSQEGRRRGSRSAMSNLATMSDPNEMSGRRMSHNTILAHNIMKAAVDPLSKPGSSILANSPPVTGSTQARRGSRNTTRDDGQSVPKLTTISSVGEPGSSPSSIKRQLSNRSNQSDGHTTNSEGVSEGAEISENSAFSIGKKSNSTTPDSSLSMDIDVDGGGSSSLSFRPASPAGASHSVNKITTTSSALSSGASTLLGFTVKR